MATVSIGWGDGTTGKITVSFTGSVGSSQMDVTSDPNTTGQERTKQIKLKTTGGQQLGTLTVTQQARSRAYSSAYSPAYG